MRNINVVNTAIGPAYSLGTSIHEYGICVFHATSTLQLPEPEPAVLPRPVSRAQSSNVA
jgi:hypothetical protein